MAIDSLAMGALHIHRSSSDYTLCGIPASRVSCADPTALNRGEQEICKRCESIAKGKAQFAYPRYTGMPPNAAVILHLDRPNDTRTLCGLPGTRVKRVPRTDYLEGKHTDSEVCSRCRRVFRRIRIGAAARKITSRGTP